MIRSSQSYDASWEYDIFNWRQTAHLNAVFLTCSTHHTFFIDEEGIEVAILTSGGAGLYIYWWCQKHCFIFPVGIYLSTLIGSIHPCSRKTSNNPFTSPPNLSFLVHNCPSVCRELLVPFCFFHWFQCLWYSSQETSNSLRFLEVLVSGTIQQQSTDHVGCSPFSVASDIQEGLGSLGRKIRLLCVVWSRLFGIPPLLPLNQY
jgi:hypothetical protein